MYAKDRRRPERTGDRSACPGCGAEVQAKCGEIVTHHWAHRSGVDCDAWAEGESDWHAGWKEAFPEEWREVTVGPHRADVRTPAGLVVEVQRSQISTLEIAARQEFYGRMAWLLDASEWSVSWPSDAEPDEFGPSAFRFEHRPQRFISFTAPVFLDFGGLWMRGLETERRLFRVTALSRLFLSGESAAEPVPEQVSTEVWGRFPFAQMSDMMAESGQTWRSGQYDPGHVPPEEEINERASELLDELVLVPGKVASSHGMRAFVDESLCVHLAWGPFDAWAPAHEFTEPTDRVFGRWIPESSFVAQVAGGDV
jgi:competence protein CoiA